jgi:hypothetical protein
MIVVDCSGDGRIRGRMHGEAAKGLVRDALQRWADATAGAAGIPMTRYVSAFLSDTALLPVMENQPPILSRKCGALPRGVACCSTKSPPTPTVPDVLQATLHTGTDHRNSSSQTCESPQRIRAVSKPKRLTLSSSATSIVYCANRHQNSTAHNTHEQADLDSASLSSSKPNGISAQD